MLTYSFISNTEVDTELYKSCAHMSTAGRKVLSAPVSVQYRLSLQLTRSALRTVESLCAMTNTVRPFMARSMASCTKCSLSASKALVACALETQRASVEEYALLPQYRQTAAGAPQYRQLWGLHSTDSCGGSTVQTAVGAPQYRQLRGLHSTDSCGGSTVQTAVGAPQYRQLRGLHSTDSCGGSTVQTAVGAPQYRQLRGLHSTDSCGGSTVQTAVGAPQYRQLWGLHSTDSCGGSTVLQSLCILRLPHLVKQQDGGVNQECPGNSHPLLLSSRQPHSPLTHKGIVATLNIGGNTNQGLGFTARSTYVYICV